MTKQSRQRLLLWFLLMAVFIVILLSVNLRYSKIPYGYVIDSLLNPYLVDSSTVLLQICLPRIILAFLCGMGLALSGCILQAVIGNQLADPGILGINAGAGFMVMLFLTLFPSLHISTMVHQPIFAMIVGLLVAWILYVFSKRKEK
ncbi:iron chelate uptake ABC transporter family permease subunit [Tissierella sp. P1]|jgi:iron complex transport system permease protein|uniref:iron chelate uptake ABC transporter family permease subunit n=1 Tax=Tissierella sp. TaxID=41274 RepID=UPI0019134939|nr:iron chelate uptake ABC transporter family permease subunit [Tissierella sp. P1]